MTCARIIAPMPKLQNASDISQPWLPSWYSLMRCPELNSGSRQCRRARRPRNVATSPRDRRARTRGDFHCTLSAWRNSVATFSLRGRIHGGGGMKWMPLGFAAPGTCVYRTRFPLRLARRLARERPPSLRPQSQPARRVSSLHVRSEDWDPAPRGSLALPCDEVPYPGQK
jgi:hypothetical protein